MDPENDEDVDFSQTNSEELLLFTEDEIFKALEKSCTGSLKERDSEQNCSFELVTNNKPTHGIDAAKHDNIEYSPQIKIQNNCSNVNKSSGVQNENMFSLLAKDSRDIQITATGESVIEETVFGEFDIMNLPVDIIETSSIDCVTTNEDNQHDLNLISENMDTMRSGANVTNMELRDVFEATNETEEEISDDLDYIFEEVENIEENNETVINETSVDIIATSSIDCVTTNEDNQNDVNLVSENMEASLLGTNVTNMELRDVFEATNETEEERCDDPDYIIEDVENIEENNETVINETSNSEVQMNSESEENIVLPEKKRKKNNSNNWKKNVNKKMRMEGKKYVGYRRDKSGRIFHDTPKEGRTMGVTCKSKLCEKSKIRFCQSINEEQRLKIFDNFWTGMNWDQRRVYLANMVEKSKVKRRTKLNKEESNEDEECESNGQGSNEIKQHRRKSTLKYHLVSNGKKLPVCQKMFLNTLGIKKWTVRYWISGDKHHSFNTSVEEVNSTGMALQGCLTRRSQTKLTKKKEAFDFLQQFLVSLAKLPSHYCRKTTSRLYLEPIFTSMSQLYNIYVERCHNEETETAKKENTLCLSRFSFEKAFKEANLSIYQPKKDKCDLCSAYEVKNVTEEEYKNHILLKDDARKLKEADKQKAKKNEIHVFTSDLEAVKVAPFLQASALYYKTKLNVHNFTMYNLGNKEATCYWFDESNAELEASVFASCVMHKLKQVLEKDKKPVVLWSDGCGYQNRNAVYSNALLHLAAENQIEIEQKFLIKGHTQMECDSVHSNIECCLKNREIHLPSQYYTATKEARQHPFPYESHYLTYSFFKNFSDKNSMAYESIRPGNKVGDPTVHDIRAILYKPDGKIGVKLDFNQKVYEDLPRRAKKIDSGRVFPDLYRQPIPIPKRKWKDLQDLKYVLPQDCHQFYDNLPFKGDN